MTFLTKRNVVLLAAAGLGCVIALCWWVLRPPTFEHLASLEDARLARTGQLWIGEAPDAVLLLAKFDSATWDPDAAEVPVPATSNIVAFQPGVVGLAGVAAVPIILASTNSLSQFERTTLATQLRFDVVSRTIALRGKRLHTAGRHVLASCLSPDGKRIAVLSADGVIPGSLIPFLGGGHVSGKRYHQVFDGTSGVTFGPTLEIYGPGAKSVGNCMWSPNGRYVVYNGSRSSQIWIAEIESYEQ